MTEGQGQVLLNDTNRIADALERIADSLEALTECVGYIPPTPYETEGIHFIRADQREYRHYVTKKAP